MDGISEISAMKSDCSFEEPNGGKYHQDSCDSHHRRSELFLL